MHSRHLPPQRHHRLRQVLASCVVSAQETFEAGHEYSQENGESRDLTAPRLAPFCRRCAAVPFGDCCTLDPAWRAGEEWREGDGRRDPGVGGWGRRKVRVKNEPNLQEAFRLACLWFFVFLSALCGAASWTPSTSWPTGISFQEQTRWCQPEDAGWTTWLRQPKRGGHSK